jgi:hypothetical protein
MPAVELVHAGGQPTEQTLRMGRRKKWENKTKPDEAKQVPTSVNRQCLLSKKTQTLTDNITDLVALAGCSVNFHPTFTRQLTVTLAISRRTQQLQKCQLKWQSVSSNQVGIPPDAVEVMQQQVFSFFSVTKESAHWLSRWGISF